MPIFDLAGVGSKNRRSPAWPPFVLTTKRSQNGSLLHRFKTGIDTATCGLAGWAGCARSRFMCVRLLYLIMIRVCGWLAGVARATGPPRARRSYSSLHLSRS